MHSGLLSSGALVVLERLCIGCHNIECDMCTFMSLAKLYGVLDACELLAVTDTPTVEPVPAIQVEAESTALPTSPEIAVDGNLGELTTHEATGELEAQKTATASGSQCGVVVVVGDGNEIGPSTTEAAVKRDTTGIPEAPTTPPSGANDGTCSASTSVSTNISKSNKSFKGITLMRI